MQFAKKHKLVRHKTFKSRDKLLTTFGAIAVSFGFGQLDAKAQNETTTTIQPGNAVEAASLAASGELTTSKIIKDPGAPYENLFRDFNAGIGASPKLGPGHGRVQAGPFNFNLNSDTPITRGFQPENAELKLGNFYLDIRELRGSLLFTDNALLTETNRKEDAIAAITLGVTGMVQLTEGLRFAISGAFIYLPLSNRGGVQGFGITDPFARFTLDGGVLAQAQVYYDFVLGKWDVVAYDDFRVINRTAYRLGEEGYVDLYNGETFNRDESFRNRQVYTPQQYQTPQFQDTTRNTDSFDYSSIDYQNTVGAYATRYLPIESIATLSYAHNNFWYSNNSNLGALVTRPTSSDRFSASIESVRENMRFKPFATYIASTTDRVSGWDQQILGGLKGPITDQINFYGEAGYLFSGNSPRETLLWRVGVDHFAGPYTIHGLRYYRVLTDPDRVLSQRLEYNLSQVLGPYLIGTFFASRGEFEDLDSSRSLVTESRIGGSLNYNLAEFGQVSSLFIYQVLDFNNPASVDYTLTTWQLNYNLMIGQKTNFRAYYQFQQKDSKQAGSSYYENLIGLSVARYF